MHEDATGSREVLVTSVTDVRGHLWKAGVHAGQLVHQLVRRTQEGSACSVSHCPKAPGGGLDLQHHLYGIRGQVTPADHLDGHLLIRSEQRGRS
jgi:hypothetical protein